MSTRRTPWRLEIPRVQADSARFVGITQMALKGADGPSKEESRWHRV